MSRVVQCLFALVGLCVVGCTAPSPDLPKTAGKSAATTVAAAREAASTSEARAGERR